MLTYITLASGDEEKEGVEEKDTEEDKEETRQGKKTRKKKKKRKQDPKNPGISNDKIQFSSQDVRVNVNTG